VQKIKSLGLKAGVAVNPATSLLTLEEILPEVDLVLLMSVNPGFGGQSFIQSCLKKIEKLQGLRAEGGLSFIIEVDGGVNADNAATISKTGADLLVAGAAVFGQEDAAVAFLDLQKRLCGL
jgi:ribulose-phosphate 3-epimerase